MAAKNLKCMLAMVNQWQSIDPGEETVSQDDIDFAKALYVLEKKGFKFEKPEVSLKYYEVQNGVCCLAYEVKEGYVRHYVDVETGSFLR